MEEGISLSEMIAFLIGILLALALVGLARRYRPKKERYLYAIGLVIAAVVYLVLGVVGGADSTWLGIEAFGVLLYSTAAWAGLRRPWLLAIGWAAHVAWDLALHLSGLGSEYTPNWYPWFCVSFDLIVAVAVLLSIKRGTN